MLFVRDGVMSRLELTYADAPPPVLPSLRSPRVTGLARGLLTGLMGPRATRMRSKGWMYAAVA